MMNKLIAAFPDNIIEALEITSKAKFRIPKKGIENILICGMGGSGIGGKMVANWVQDELQIPVHIHHDYFTPNFVSENTLVICSSYSGNTEETLECLQGVMQKGAHIVAVTSGGKLAETCKENGFDYVLVPGGNPPRTALAFSVVQVLNILSELNLIEGKELHDIKRASALLKENSEAIHAKAKELAAFLHKKVPIFYTNTKYEAVAVRARQQFNENSKMLCWHHVIPEMNHNELVGWDGGDDRFAPVFLDTEDWHKRNTKRLEINLDRIQEKTNVLILKAKGESIIERSLFLINIIDWASLYLSELKNVDPIDIEVIDFLKAELAKF